MKWIVTGFMLAGPSVAFAGYGHGVGGCLYGPGSGHLAAVLLAGVAALGYWVLRQSEKDVKIVRWAGQTVGWVLLVVGLLGFLCGSWSHIKSAASGTRYCPHGEVHGTGSTQTMEMPPGHPPLGGMDIEKPLAPRSKKRDR